MDIIYRSKVGVMLQDLYECAERYDAETHILDDYRVGLTPSCARRA